MSILTRPIVTIHTTINNNGQFAITRYVPNVIHIESLEPFIVFKGRDYILENAVSNVLLSDDIFIPCTMVIDNVVQFSYIGVLKSGTVVIHANNSGTAILPSTAILLPLQDYDGPTIDSPIKYESESDSDWCFVDK